MPDDDFASGSTLGMSAAGDATQAELALGAMLGRFRLRRRIGVGGMGMVYAGEDVQLGRPVAIKVVRRENETGELTARLLREAQALARVEHPNVVRVYEVNSERGQVYIAMEYVDGTTLTAWQRHPRAWEDVLVMYDQVGVGLAAVHAAGLVHRDFKPDNVLVDRDSHARVADFGLARLTEKDAKSPMAPLTNTGAMMGTPGYMAPEQMVGADVDARADQYSYCVALREALGGRPLDDTRWNLVPRSVRDVVNRGLSYDPDERFPTMDALLAALRAAAGQHESRWMTALLVLFVLGGVAGIVAYASSRRHGAAPGDARVEVAQGAGDAVAAIHELAPDAHEPVAIADAAPADPAHVPAPPVPPNVPPHVPAPPSPAPAPHVPAPPHVAAVDAGAPADAPAIAQAPPGLAIQIPTTKHLAVAQVGDPGHLPIVRAAIADLGYDGIDLRDLAAIERDATAALQTASGPELGAAQVRLAMVKRRHGDCAGALTLWSDAKTNLRYNDPDPAKQWLARAALGTALCQLAAGSAADAWASVQHAFVDGNRDEVRLLMGFIAYEQGKKDEAYGLLLVAERLPNRIVQASLKAWLDGLGLGLR